MVGFDRRTVAAPLCGVLLAVACWIASAKADEASDYLAAAGDQVDAFADCTTDFARPLLKSSQSPEQIADAATQACESKLDAVHAALMVSPTHLPEAKADEVIGQLRDRSKLNLANLIRKARE